jgi:tetratricopeptide (TPR) repeat protein
VVAPDHRAVLVTKSNLATILADKGDLERAASIFEDLVTLLANGNKEFRELQRDRFNLANTYVKLGRIEEAREVAQAAVDGFSRALPADYPDRITAQETLSQIAICQGDFESARRIDTEVLAARARILPKNHPDLQKAQLNLAQLLAIQKRVAEDTGESATAIDDSDFTALVAAAVAGLESHVRSAILASSRRETEALCANRGDQLDRVLSMALGLQVFPDCGTLERGAFELSEMVRGAALTSARLRRHSQNSAAAVELRTRLIAASTEIARLSQSGASIDAIHAAVTSRDEAEQELIALAGPDDAAVTMRPDAEALAARLPKFTAIVAFRSYSHTIIPKGARGSKGRQDLCAFVLRRSPDGTGCVMNRVELGPIELFERAVHAWRDAIGATVERSMAPGAKALDDENAAADAELLRGRELRKLLLDPLLPVLGDANHLVVVFDDVLHLVALDALPLDLPEKPDPAAPALVGEKWRVEVRSTLSELLHEPPSTAGSNLLVAFGGATYNSEPIAPDDQDSTKVAAVPPPTAGAEILRGGTWERGFRPLPNTGPESHGVGDLFEEHFGDQGTSRILDGKRASREALVELAPRARWLHVATHGWFAPDSVRSWSDARPSGPEIDGLLRLDRADWVRGMSPMLLSGLALAGANLQADAVGRVPGLVTAEELSALDLGNCELAVLSACDTNVGDRRAGQGVASLQKALQMAGARSVITSLWKVPDDATLDLMLDFYQRLWVRKEPKWQALWEAKLMLRAKHDDVGRPLHSTRDWAGWVLTGEPE